MTPNPSDHSEANVPVANTINDARLAKAADVPAEHNPRQDFKIGFFMGVLFAFAGFSLSLEMTHKAVSEASAMQWTGAIALPILLGTLTAIFKAPFLKAITAATSVLPY